MAAPAGSTAVVRVRNFNGGTIQNLGFNTEGIRAGNVLLFFPDAFSVNFANVGLSASLLAPQASLDFSNTWIGGTVISRFIFGAGSFGNSAWDGDLSGCTSDDVPHVPVGCAYDWNVVNSWGTGAQVQVDMTWYQQPVNGWEARWEFDHAETIASGWNGQFIESSSTFGNDSAVSVTDAGWNSQLATDASVSFGMILNTPFDTATEYSFTLDGTNCMPLP